MTWQDRQIELKLDIMDSLARSQRALAQILENVAGVTETDPGAAKQLSDNLYAIAKYQGVLAERLGGFRISRRRLGTPGLPWINGRLQVLPAKQLALLGDRALARKD